jgi:hypothetical protein
MLEMLADVPIMVGIAWLGAAPQIAKIYPQKLSYYTLPDFVSFKTQVH